MALVPRRQPSAAVSTGLSVATAALNIAGAAADAVPIAKQILNSAARISAAAERIQKKREDMYTPVERSDIYATQINIAVAGRIPDTLLRRRLERLYSIFTKIEALVDSKAGANDNALTRAWRNVVTRPNRAETLVVELEREIQLFQLLTGIQLSLIADDTARAVAADAKYDGQFRILRDCEIEKLDMIHKRETDEGAIVWASARVKRQLMVIRYPESQTNAQTNAAITLDDSSHRQSYVLYHEYLENIKTASTVRGSHPHVVQLFGRHIQGPAVVFRSGTLSLDVHLEQSLRPKESNEEDAAVERLKLAYKILDASAHLSDTLDLKWVGVTALVDENGEPRIGVFDDIVRADPVHSPSCRPSIYCYIFLTINSHYTTGQVDSLSVKSDDVHVRPVRMSLMQPVDKLGFKSCRANTAHHARANRRPAVALASTYLSDGTEDMPSPITLAQA